MVDGQWSMGEEGDLQTSTSIPGGGGRKNQENLSSKKFTNRSLNKRFIKESHF